ncbi:hypothetical protein [Halobacillus salinus]|uniref:hypothetical protein n=1 Tax=Halobacillus salinus TaxID=192814 RepID=UPI0009A5DE36|nr:hypothetical protein [Halobacillus salinus]
MPIINGNRLVLYFLLLSLTIIISACAHAPDKPDFETYEGHSLKIAVVGEAPEVAEDQVEFREVSFEELPSMDSNSYDAVFITEDNLTEASESQYADLYSDSPIPFFFIGAKSHIPFTAEDAVYDDSWKWEPGNSYAVGIKRNQEDGSSKNWGFGLSNEEKSKEHIADVYSRIFKIIEETET